MILAMAMCMIGWGNQGGHNCPLCEARPAARLYVRLACLGRFLPRYTHGEFLLPFEIFSGHQGVTYGFQICIPNNTDYRHNSVAVLLPMSRHSGLPFQRRHRNSG